MALKIDVNSATWVALTAHIKERQASLRANLEGELDWEATLVVRAKLKELKSIIDLVKVEVPLVDYIDQPVDGSL